MNLRLFLTSLCCLVSLAIPARTQNLRTIIKEIDLSEFPVVSLKVDVTFSGSSQFRLTESNFKVFENGSAQPIIGLFCPGDSTVRLSVAILLDRSGSMTRKPPPFDNDVDPDSTKIRAAKAAIRTFIGFLGDRDEAGIFSFSSNQFPAMFYTINQDFTNDTAALRRSLVPIAADGGTWIYRAMMRTLDSLKSRLGKRVLIVLTDGKSSLGDGYTSANVVNKAVTEKIPVYTIGLGSDVEESQLIYIANSTGGRYYRSPNETRLEQIFQELANEIVTDACLLKYISSNPCFDGTKRDVEVLTNVFGNFSEDDTSYVISNRLNPITMTPGNLSGVVSKSLVRIPVFLQQMLTPLEPLQYSFELHYDISLIQFQGISTDNTISTNGAIQANEFTPGVVSISMPSMTPSIVTGSLVDLDFWVYGSATTATTRLEIKNAALSQGCPTNVTTLAGDVEISPCDLAYTVGTKSIFIDDASQYVLIPLHIDPSVQTGVPIDFNTDILFDRAQLTFAGLEKAGSISAYLPVNTIAKEGWLNFSIKGIVQDSSSLLTQLRFRTIPSLYVTRTELALSNTLLRTDCRTTYATLNPTVIINGECEMVLTRKPFKQTIRNNPNPFNPGTAIVFTLVEDGHARLSVHDAAGREVALLVEGILAAGEYRMRFDGSALPSGTYFGLLSSGGRITIHPMLLMK